MEQKLIDKVCKQIYQRFPMVRKTRPKISKQGSDRYLLIFSGSGSTPDGEQIQHTVRVVASEDGRILKTSTSR